jgi:hypothetical protein
MRKLLDWMFTADEHGDSPIGLIVAVGTFLICMYAIACMPGH